MIPGWSTSSPTPDKSGGRRRADGDRGRLDGTDEVEDASVLQPHAVLEEPAQLLGKVADRLLGALGSVGPVVVHGTQPLIGADPRDRLHLGEETGHLVLPVLAEQEVVEGLEAASLVGGGDVGAAADQLGEQPALAAIPARDLLARRSVQGPEVLLHLAEVGQQLASGRGELLVPVADRGLVHNRDVARLDLCDLLVDLRPASLQLGEPDGWVLLRAVDDLPQQLHQGVQT